MHQLSACLLALALSLASVEAWVYVSINRCPRPITMNYILTDPFMGTWYEYGSFRNQFLTGCTKITYTSNGQLIDVEKESVTLFFKSSLKGQMKRADPSRNDTKFTINWIENVFEGFENNKTPVNYQVLETDYTNYAIIFNCMYILRYFLFKIDIYVYTRDRVPSEGLINHIEGQLGFRGYDIDDLIQTNQRDCNN